MHRTPCAPILVICLTVLLTGCALLTRGPEPSRVALRNSSGKKLAGLAVSEARGAVGSAARLGAVSPALAGETYFLDRRPGAPALPGSAVVAWQDYGGAYRKVTVDVKTALRSATGEPGETLVFELGTGGRIDVYLEIIPPSSAPSRSP